MTEAEKLKEELFRKTKSGWECTEDDKKMKIFEFCDSYIEFLNNSKTEREIVKSTKKLIEQNGFKNIVEYEKLVPGDKIYYINRNKSIYLAVIGEDSIEKGINISDLKDKEDYEIPKYTYIHSDEDLVFEAEKSRAFKFEEIGS